MPRCLTKILEIAMMEQSTTLNDIINFKMVNYFVRLCSNYIVLTCLICHIYNPRTCFVHVTTRSIAPLWKWPRRHVNAIDQQSISLTLGSQMTKFPAVLTFEGIIVPYSLDHSFYCTFTAVVA